MQVSGGARRNRDPRDGGVGGVFSGGRVVLGVLSLVRDCRVTASGLVILLLDYSIRNPTTGGFWGSFSRRSGESFKATGRVPSG